MRISLVYIAEDHVAYCCLDIEATHTYVAVLKAAYALSTRLERKRKFCATLRAALAPVVRKTE